MKLLLKVFLLSRPKEQGFVLPVIIALGLIMTLIGTISIFQSSDEQLTATSQRATAKALAAAEIGVAHYRELIDKNKIIALYDACETGTWTDADCDDDGTNTSWEQATNITNIAASCLANAATTVAGIATRDWQNIDASNPEDGQYRLIDYTYTSNYNSGTNNYTSQPIGTLIVEGRVNQSNTNQNELDADPQAAVARVAVDLPIQPGIPTPNGENIELEGNFNNLNPVLWITGSNEKVSDVNGLKVNGNIVVTDSNCTLSSTPVPTTSNLQGYETSPPPPTSILPQSIVITPLQPQVKTFPVDNADIDAVPDGNSDINLLTASEIANLSTNNISLPRPGDVSQTLSDGSIYYHYKQSDPNPTDITLNGTDLDIRAGRKVILYLNGNITLQGNANPNGVDLNSRPGNGNKSYNLEIYGSNNTTDIKLKGNGTINIKALIHAPNATVTVEDNPTVVINGAVWVKDWDGSSSLTNDVLIRPDPNTANPNNLPPTPADVSQQFYNYTYIKNDLVNAGVRVVDPIISVPSRWETQEAE